MSEDFISVHEAAKIIGVSPQQVNRYCVKGQLPSTTGARRGRGVQRQIRRRDALAFTRPKYGPKGPRRVAVVAALVLLTILIALPVSAQSPEPPSLDNPHNVLGVLGWLAAGGAAPAISLWLSKQKWFNQIADNQVKVTLTMGLIVGVPLLAKALTDFVPATVWTVLQPWWAVAVAALEIGWPLSQATYLLMGRNLKQA
ncbi:MAG: helix-turn-helix domain-containing protein [Anaerolineae bacterium]|nr:helix-turn-helix domain-containing protein [Anaerolineae bacterium]